MFKDIINIFKKPQAPSHYIGYHGTRDMQRAIRACFEGIKPGNGDNYGVGVYATAGFPEAQSYAADQGGAILRFHIRVGTYYKDYDHLPGNTREEKRAWAMSNLNGFVFVREKSWYLFYGHYGQPVTIPGLDYVYLLDYHGNEIQT